jgi:hypothetical protein
MRIDLPIRSAFNAPRKIRFLIVFGCSCSFFAACLIVFRSLFVVSNLWLLGVYLARLRETRQPLGGSLIFDYRRYWITERDLLGAVVALYYYMVRTITRCCQIKDLSIIFALFPRFFT